MATRKKPSGASGLQSSGKSRGPGFGCLLWLAFLILLLGLFLFNKAVIERVLDNTQFIDKVFKAPKTEEPNKDTPKETKPIETVPPAKPTEPAPLVDAAPIVVEAPPENPPAAKPIETKQPVAETPAAKPVEKTPTPAPTLKKVETRERAVWFVRIDDDGLIVRVKAKRQLPVSDSPLFDTIVALSAGPTDAEKKKGTSSLIPPGTKLLSATVRGSTAYLSFSENFQFNSFGIEGYAAQLRQVIWTATEFETVKDVQILIEGRRVDYLGPEGIWIGSPLGRDSL